MKINLSESMVGRTTVLAGMVCLSFSSCKLPKSDAYSKAEWAVHTTVTKDELPVGVSLEHIEDAPIPAPEDIAAGLPAPQVDNEDPFSGLHEPHTPVSGELLDSPSLAVLPPATNVHPPTLAAESEKNPPPAILANNATEANSKPVAPPGPSYPAPNPTVAANPSPSAGNNSAASPVVRTIPEIEVKPPILEIKPAVINPTPENHARMMAASTRPPMAPRGGAESPSKPSPEVVASNSPSSSPMPTAAPPDNLTQILKLAKRIEETKKKAP